MGESSRFPRQLVSHAGYLNSGSPAKSRRNSTKTADCRLGLIPAPVFFVTFVGDVEIKQSCLSSKQILLKEIMRTSLKLFLFSAAVSLLLVFFYNDYSLTRPWTRLIFLTRGANTDDTLLRGYASLRDDKEQAERAGEALEIEKSPKTFESRHVLELGMKLKEPSPNENDGTTQSDEKDRKEETYQLQQTFAKRKNLIILSPGRGGSTFLGSLFDRNPHVMYFFKPLYAVKNEMFKVNLELGDKEPENYKETSIKVIDSLLQCNFSNISNSTLASFSSHFHRNRSKALSRKYLPKISNTLLSKACNNYNHTVLKILSGRLPNGTIKTFKELLQQQNRYDVKVVHLVRDPRAVVFSRVKVPGWMWGHLDPSFHKNVQDLCHPILQNIRLGLLYPSPWLKERFKVIRYEDLALNTLNVAQELYRFAGFDWSASVHEFISALKTNTKQGGAYSVYRNATVAISRWKRAPEPFIRAVENICGELMDFLGYEKWKKQD